MSAPTLETGPELGLIQPGNSNLVNVTEALPGNVISGSEGSPGVGNSTYEGPYEEGVEQVDPSNVITDESTVTPAWELNSATTVSSTEDSTPSVTMPYPAGEGVTSENGGLSGADALPMEGEPWYLDNSGTNDSELTDTSALTGEEGASPEDSSGLKDGTEQETPTGETSGSLSSSEGSTNDSETNVNSEVTDGTTEATINDDSDGEQAETEVDNGAEGSQGNELVDSNDASSESNETDQPDTENTESDDTDARKNDTVTSVPPSPEKADRKGDKLTRLAAPVLAAGLLLSALLPSDSGSPNNDPGGKLPVPAEAKPAKDPEDLSKPGPLDNLSPEELAAFERMVEQGEENKREIRDANPGLTDEEVIRRSNDKLELDMAVAAVVAKSRNKTT